MVRPTADINVMGNVFKNVHDYVFHVCCIEGVHLYDKRSAIK